MLEPPPLPPGITLQAWADGRLVFESRGKWLHPLFALGEHLEAHPQDGLLLRDTIVGRAAAFLIARLSVRKVWTTLASRRAVSVFEESRMELFAEKWTDRIDCLTEDALSEIRDPEQAWNLLAERRRAAQAFGR